MDGFRRCGVGSGIEEELPVVMFLQVAGRRLGVGLARFGGFCHLLGMFV